jgi:hypothetical protein
MSGKFAGASGDTAVAMGLSSSVVQETGGRARIGFWRSSDRRAERGQKAQEPPPGVDDQSLLGFESCGNGI